MLTVLFIIVHLFWLVNCSEVHKNDSNIHVTESLRHHEHSKNQYGHVHIYNDNIPEIVKDFIYKYSGVVNLEIETCNVHEIERGAFESVKTTLQTLNLRNNKLERINRRIFEGLNLTELNLGHNNIEYIEEDAFSSMNNLKKLKLNNNNIQKYTPAWFTLTMRHPPLCEFNLEHNAIEKIPSFAFIDDLNEVECLKKVHFSHNKIKFVHPWAFARNANFDELYLDHNQIEYLHDDTFALVQEIKKLRLDHNNIHCIETPLPVVKEVDVRGNPWNCQCLENYRKRYNFIKTDESCRQT